MHVCVTEQFCMVNTGKNSRKDTLNMREKKHLFWPGTTGSGIVKTAK